MDQAALLTEQVAGGRKLVNKLLARGADLLAACWAKLPERQTWRLFLVIPGEGDARREASALVDRVLDELEPEWASAAERVEWYVVQVIPPHDPLARGLLTDTPAALRKWPMQYGERLIGDTLVEGAFKYAPVLFDKPAAAAGN